MLKGLTLPSAVRAQLDAERRITEQHRKWEGETLAEIKSLAVATNGRVSEHDVKLALLEASQIERNIREIAAKKTADERSNSRMTVRQGAIYAFAGSLFSGGGVEVLHLLGVL